MQNTIVFIIARKRSLGSLSGAYRSRKWLKSQRSIFDWLNCRCPSWAEYNRRANWLRFADS